MRALLRRDVPCRPFPRLVAASLLFALACAGPGAGSAGRADVSVVLRRVETPELSVEVEVRARGERDGETVFALAREWGGVGPERRDLVDLEARTPVGAALVLEQDGPQRWRVEHAPRAELVVTARVRANRLRGGVERDHYRPIVEPDLFHGIAQLLVPLPEHLDDDEELEVEVAFEGFAALGHEALCSFGAGHGPHRARARVGELRSALFVAGELDVFRRELSGRPLYVSLDDNAWAFDGGAFADLVARVVELERALMDDPDVSFYWVSAIAVGQPDPLGLSLGGTGLAHAFALFLQPDAPIALGSRGGLPIRRLLAHECFHDWNGVRIRLADPEETSYWFSEGFTDHFARRVLREAGWLDERAYAASLSTLLADYHTSPARNVPADELGQRFWTDPDAQRQPYLRGDVVAAIVDAAIRTRSRGRADLAHLLRDLVRESDQSGRRFDTKALLERIGDRAGPGAAAQVRRVVVDGATAELPDDAFGPGFTLVEREVFAYDPGFDVEASLEGKVVRGVLPGSPAEQAGLVDGQAILGWSVYRGDPDRELRLTVEQDGTRREVTYLPRGESSVVPQVVVAGAVPAASRR